MSKDSNGNCEVPLVPLDFNPKFHCRRVIHTILTTFWCEVYGVPYIVVHSCSSIKYWSYLSYLIGAKERYAHASTGTIRLISNLTRRKTRELIVAK